MGSVVAVATSILSAVAVAVVEAEFKNLECVFVVVRLRHSPENQRSLEFNLDPGEWYCSARDA